MGRPLQSVFLVLLITLAFSKVIARSKSISSSQSVSRSVEKSSEPKLNGAKDNQFQTQEVDLAAFSALNMANIPESFKWTQKPIKRFGSVDQIGEKLPLTRFISQQNGQANEIGLNQLLEGYNSSIKKPNPIPFDVHGQSAQQKPSIIVSDSKKPTNPEVEYLKGKFRLELEHANKFPELWLANAKWSCPKGDAECEGWKKIYVAIRRFIAFKLKQQIPTGKEIPLKMVAVKPRFWPNVLNKLERIQTNAIGIPRYAKQGEMEMVQVMRMVELAFKISKDGADNGNIPVHILNEELVENVYNWAAFYAEAIEVGQTVKVGKIYKIVEDNQSTRIVKTLEDFAWGKERAEQILKRIRIENQILNGFELAEWKVPLPPILLELTEQKVDLQKKDIGTLNMQEREEFANLWKPIVEVLQKEKAKKTVIRYVQRQQMERPGITRELVFENSVLLIPRPEEFVPIVYVYENGKPLGNDLAGELAKAELCLHQIQENMSKQLAQLKEECPIPTNIEGERKEKFEAFVRVAKALNSDLPATFLDQNDQKMDKNVILKQLAVAFDAIVSGKKLDVFVPSMEKKGGKIKGMVNAYGNLLQKDKAPEIVRRYKDPNWARKEINKLVKFKAEPDNTSRKVQRILPKIGDDGMTNAQRKFKKEYEELKKQKLKVANEPKPATESGKKKAVWPASHHRAGFSY